VKPFKKIVASTGKYVNSNGEEKNRYQNIGTLFQGDDGRLSAKIDALPIGEWNGWVNFYDIEDKPRQQQAAPQKPQQQYQAPNDEVPF